MLTINQFLKEKDRLLFLPFVIVLGIFAAFAISLLAAIWPIDLVSLANGGLFGDSFGALNALFSGLGFAGVLVTLMYQQRQLKIQQEELNSTQAELRRQSALFDQQKFDDSFFQLLGLVRENLNSLMHRNAETKEEIRGIDLLAARLKRLRDHLKQLNLGEFPATEPYRVIYFWSLSKGIQNGLGRQARYVETVSCLVRWIAEHCPRDADPQPYWDMAAAQLTVYEASYLCYQTMVSSEDHPLRRYFDLENSFFRRLASCGINVAHVKALLWLVGSDTNMMHPKFPPVISVIRVKDAKRAIRTEMKAKAEEQRE
ncbi:hypothetical protein [Lysobacter sp. CFH 32150]|uniref:hypothetical protein n=1 Tax=Lysobacter sp. CFH 32150 TaxID=2927128 RepID=UPI001FA75B1A|nr:hypothetical protein [Lysobacter sp. CFH 32150]MCI4568523.1 hypothetical protein [Lysobacter sp. CFH 32150]